MRTQVLRNMGLIALALFCLFSVHIRITRATERAEAAENEVQDLEFRLEQLEYEQQEKLSDIESRLEDIESYSHWH